MQQPPNYGQGYGPPPPQGYPPPGYGQGPGYPPPKKGMSTGMIVLIVFGCLFGGCVMCGVAGSISNKNKEAAQTTPENSPANVATTAAPTPKAAPKPKVKPPPPVQATASQLSKDYESNEVAADDKWKGKRVAITGVVAGTKKDFMDDIYVVLGSGAQFETHQVQAFLSKKEKAKAAQLQNGTKTTLTCRIDGMIIMNVIGKDCIVGNGGDDDDE